MDNRRALRIANGYFAEFLGRIPVDGWGRATPCPEWTVRGLVGHVAAGHAALARAFDPDGPEDPPGGDPVGECLRWADRAQAAAELPGALERTVRHAMFGELSGDALLLIRWGDVCVHAWDLAQALGADFTPDPELTEAALEWLVPFAPGLSATGAFAPAADPGPAADPFARVLALTGRRVV